jgi:membrane protein YqaA with SNARE-associated domain
MSPDFIEWGYLGMFLSSFLAATILPFSSELIFSGLLYAGSSPLLLISSAVLGNCLGGMSSYYLGWFASWDRIAKYIGIKQAQVLRWENHIQRHGSIAAFFTWLPVIGDPIAVALGVFKTPVAKTIFWMFIGKTARYVVIYLILTRMI